MPSKPAFTPGPWSVDRSLAEASVHVTAAQPVELDICTMADWRKEFYSERMANAHLIATAPDMYDALEMVLMDATEYFPKELIEVVTLTLNKARGTAQ